MPDTRAHRGPHPEDRMRFADQGLATLQRATVELSWLLSRSYPVKASVKLVGDRHRLDARQREAVRRASCSDEQRRSRLARRVATPAQGDAVLLDGFNVLTTVEAGLAGGVLLLCRDGVLRDMASVHGTFRTVVETMPALETIGEMLQRSDCGPITWLLDQPVSNSGRLRQRCLALAAARGWPWRVELVADPDALLTDARELVVSADSAVLDGSCRWWNLARVVVEACVPAGWIRDLTGEGDS